VSQAQPTGVGDTDVVVDGWDTQAQPQPVAAPAAAPQQAVVAPDIVGQLVKELELDAKDYAGLVTTLKEYKAKANGRKALPEDLSKAIEVAESGGDHKKYLQVSGVDYSKMDPEKLFEDYVYDNATNPDGTVDYDAVEEYLKDVKPTERIVRGREIQQRLVAYQQQQLRDMERTAAETKERANSQLREALNRTVDISGFKLTDAHRQELFQWISSGQMMRDMFYSGSGEFDFAKLVKNAALARFGEKFDAFRRTQIKNAAKRELHNELSNPVINTPPQPVEATPKKGYGLDDFLNEIREKRKI
jgi:hypothetical protein